MDFIHIILFFPNNRWKLKSFFLMTDMVLDKNLLRWEGLFFHSQILIKSILQKRFKKEVPI